MAGPVCSKTALGEYYIVAEGNVLMTLLMNGVCAELDSTAKSGGMAFEVLLKPATAVSPRLVQNATPTDRRISMELIDKKLKDAQDRRKVRAAPFVRGQCNRGC